MYPFPSPPLPNAGRRVSNASPRVLPALARPEVSPEDAPLPPGSAPEDAPAAGGSRAASRERKERELREKAALVMPPPFALHKARGDVTSAAALYAEALDARRAQLGPAHPDTLTSINNVSP